jgi:hypothetical protein
MACTKRGQSGWCCCRNETRRSARRGLETVKIALRSMEVKVYDQWIKYAFERHVCETSERRVQAREPQRRTHASELYIHISLLRTPTRTPFKELYSRSVSFEQQVYTPPSSNTISLGPCILCFTQGTL